MTHFLSEKVVLWFYHRWGHRVEVVSDIYVSVMTADSRMSLPQVLKGMGSGSMRNESWIRLLVA